jgi:hypothetical protein
VIVIFKKKETIVERMEKAVRDANRNNRRINAFHLTPDEHDEYTDWAATDLALLLHTFHGAMVIRIPDQFTGRMSDDSRFKF